VSRTICDVVIVGAGILGCATAFHLARRRSTRVIVVEKGSLASGMTKRSGALIHAQHRYETETRLAHASLRDFQNWKERTGATCGFTPTGCAIVVAEKDAATLRAQAERLQKIGGRNQILSPQELLDREPNARVDDLSLAAYEPDAGYADPVLATQTLAARAKENGVVFKTGTMATSIRVNAGRVAGVETTTGDIEALAVVLMIGAWTDRLLKPLGVQIGIQNTRAQVVFFDRPAELKQGHTAFIDWTTGAHFRPHTFGLTMAGLDVSQVEEKNPDSFDESISPNFVTDTQRRIAARLPALAQARYIRGHAGIYDSAPDARPVIGRVPGIAGLFVAAGFRNEGFALAPAVGACVSEMVTDGEASTVDVSDLGLERLNNIQTR
jgi:sarcosine oxidase subunit beta